MENDLISRSALLEELSCLIMKITGLRAGKSVLREFLMEYRESVLRIIDKAPAVDAVPVVRCKDCKHYMTIHCTCDGCCISDYWFCADGERRG